MLIKRVPNGDLHDNNSAFVVFYTDPIKIYEAVDTLGDTVRQLGIPLMGANLRWDGSLGFVGGIVDPGETILQAALREAGEEVGYVPEAKNVVLVCSHRMVSSTRTQNTHLFACKVSKDEIYAIRQRACTTEHGETESAGFNVLHMHSKTLQNLDKMHWAGTALSEVKLLLEQGILALSA